MKNIACFLLCACIAFSCKKPSILTAALNTNSISNATVVNAEKSAYWDSVFTRFGNGWTGGDAAVSYKLPDGRVLWLWGDSFLDTVYPDRHRPAIPFIHNQMTTTDMKGGNFTTYHGGTSQNPKSYFEAVENKFYWPCFAFMNKNNTSVYVFLDKVETFGTGAFDFKIVGVDVAVLKYPSLAIQKIVPFSTDTTVNWAGDAFESGDGYVYLYGAESTKYNKFVHVARISKTNPLNVTYWNGSTWTTNADSSTRVLGGVSEGFSFFQYQGKQYLLSQENLLGPNIYLWNAASPVGPFTKKRLVYTTPQKVGAFPVWTYNAKAHLQFTTNNHLLVGYCSNAQTGTGLYKNADTYRPYFVWVGDWQ